MKLWVKILIALFLGAIVGLSANQGWLPAELISIISPFGSIFLNLISMLIVPLVLASMTVGITSIHDPQKLSRIGIRCMLIYMLTTLIAIALGITFAKIFQPGASLELVASAETSQITPPTIKEMLISIFPSNPVVSLVEGNVLQIIVFSIFLGIAINFAGSKGKPLLDLLSSLADVMFKLTSIIMEFSPVGVFAIMATVTSNFGFAVLLPLLKFLMVYYAACLFHVIVIFCSLLHFFAGLNPIPFFKGMSDACMMAFSTCSSGATLPVTMHCVQKNLGVSKSLSGFVVPLGASINMNGAAIFQGMSALFVAQAYNIHLEWYSLLIIMFAATLSTIGAAGIPGTGFILLTVVFSSVGLPIEGLALLAGIDRLREMVSTVLNVLADAVCAVCIAKQEGELDEKQYNHDTLVQLEGSEI